MAGVCSVEVVRSSSGCSGCSAWRCRADLNMELVIDGELLSSGGIVMHKNDICPRYNDQVIYSESVSTGERV